MCNKLGVIKGLLFGQSGLTGTLAYQVMQARFKQALEAFAVAADLSTPTGGMGAYDTNKQAFRCDGQFAAQPPSSTRSEPREEWYYRYSSEFKPIGKKCAPKFLSGRGLLDQGVAQALTLAAQAGADFIKHALLIFYQAGTIIIPALNGTAQEDLLQTYIIEPIDTLLDQARGAWGNLTSETATLKEHFMSVLIKNAPTGTQTGGCEGCGMGIPDATKGDMVSVTDSSWSAFDDYMAWDVKFVSVDSDMKTIPNCVTLVKKTKSLDTDEMHVIDYRIGGKIQYDKGGKIIGFCTDSASKTCKDTCGEHYYDCKKGESCEGPFGIKGGHQYNCIGAKQNIFTLTKLYDSSGLPVFDNGGDALGLQRNLLDAVKKSLSFQDAVDSVVEPVELLHIYKGANKTRTPSYAFTYTNSKDNFVSAVTSAGFPAAYVYAGDVEFYCRGQPTNEDGGGASSNTTFCSFGPHCPNAFVYYSDAAKAAATAFAKAGIEVCLNFDGRLAPKDLAYVPNFSLLTEAEEEDFAGAIAKHVCEDPNVACMGYDVEPFDNNQVGFFSKLDKKLAACKKKFGVFTFAEQMNATMWDSGLGTQGYLLDSTYDLPCNSSVLPPNGCQPCQCIPPDVYKLVLLEHLLDLLALATKPFQLVVSASASTQIYETIYLKHTNTITTPGVSKCHYGSGLVVDAQCNNTMADWMEKAFEAMKESQVLESPLFNGIVVYEWTTGSTDGFYPTEASASVLNVLRREGVL